MTECLNSCNCKQKVSWKEQTTASGIQLSPGLAADHTGTLVGTQVIPISPSQFTILYIVKKDSDNSVLIMNAIDAKLL